MPRIYSLLLGLCVSSADPASAQTPGTRPMAVVISAGLTKQLGADALPLSGALGLGIHWPISSASAITLEAGYTGLGSRKERSNFVSLFPPPITHYLTTVRTQRLLRASVGLDHQLGHGLLRPHLLLGLNAGGFFGEYRSVSRDSTGTVLSQIHNRGWGKALGPHIGAGIEWTGSRNGLVPGLEARLYGLMTDAGDGWSGITFWTVGLTLRH